MQLKLILVLIYVQLVLGSEDWETFMRTYGKVYKNPKEENVRKQIFHENVKLIEQHNRKYDQGLSSFMVKVNKFADRTKQEIHPFSKSTQKHAIESGAAGTSRSFPRQEVPESIDWRDYGVISPIPDQIFCQSCWAFAVVGAVEAHMGIYRQENVSLSQQNLVDCVDPNFTCDDYLDPDMLQKTYEYIISNGGMDTADSYPYEANSSRECRFTVDNVGATISSYGNVTQDDEEELKVIVGTIGPVSVTITTDLRWDFYQQGIYNNPNCMDTNEIFNHAVVVVGYGSENGTEFWLVKNSWGTWYGEEGYIRMARNSGNVCGIASIARYPLML